MARVTAFLENSAECGKKTFDLVVDFSWVCHGLSDFSPQKLLIPLPHAISRHLRSCLGHPQLDSHLCIRFRRCLSDDERFEPLELF